LNLTGTPLAWYLMCFSCCPQFTHEPLHYIPRGLPFMNLLFALRIITAASLVKLLQAGDVFAMKKKLEESRKEEVDLLKQFKDDAASDSASPFIAALRDGGVPRPAAAGGGGGGGGGSSGSSASAAAAAAAAAATTAPAGSSPGSAARWSGCSPAVTHAAEEARRYLQTIPHNYIAAVFMIQFCAYVFYFLDGVADSEKWQSEYKESYMKPKEEVSGGGGGAAAAASGAAAGGGGGGKKRRMAAGEEELDGDALDNED
jgi:hypothetical protein